MARSFKSDWTGRDVFDALANPVRRQILELLAHGEMTAGQLAGHFDLSQPTMSSHLKKLRESLLVRVRQDGGRHIYRLDRAPLRSPRQWLDRLGAPSKSRPKRK